MSSLQDCSVLSFIFDNLLPSSQDVGDKDTPALCRVLIASLAACNHSPETQLQLASEIKLALQRALLLPETAEKHSRIQSLASIIATVIDACPVSGAIPNQVTHYVPSIKLINFDSIVAYYYHYFYHYCYYYLLCNNVIYDVQTYKIM